MGLLLPVQIGGTPFTIVESDWPDDAIPPLLATFQKVWKQLPSLIQGVVRSYVERESTPVIRLATNRFRWKGKGGWAAFVPKERVIWVHSSPFMHRLDADLLEAGIAHELAHVVFFILGEHWHQRATIHGGPEWLVLAIMPLWGYDPERAEEWRRFLDPNDDLLPQGHQPIDRDTYNQLRDSERKDAELVDNNRAKFLAENRAYIDVASGNCADSLKSVAESQPEQLPEAIRQSLLASGGTPTQTS